MLWSVEYDLDSGGTVQEYHKLTIIIIIIIIIALHTTTLLQVGVLDWDQTPPRGLVSPAVTGLARQVHSVFLSFLCLV